MNSSIDGDEVYNSVKDFESNQQGRDLPLEYSRGVSDQIPYVFGKDTQEYWIMEELLKPSVTNPDLRKIDVLRSKLLEGNGLVPAYFADMTFAEFCRLKLGPERTAESIFSEKTRFTAVAPRPITRVFLDYFLNTMFGVPADVAQEYIPRRPLLNYLDSDSTEDKEFIRSLILSGTDGRIDTIEKLFSTKAYAQHVFSLGHIDATGQDIVSLYMHLEKMRGTDASDPSKRFMGSYFPGLDTKDSNNKVEAYALNDPDVTQLAQIDEGMALTYLMSKYFKAGLSSDMYPRLRSLLGSVKSGMNTNMARLPLLSIQDAQFVRSKGFHSMLFHAEKKNYFHQINLISQGRDIDTSKEEIIDSLYELAEEYADHGRPDIAIIYYSLYEYFMYADEITVESLGSMFKESLDVTGEREFPSWHQKMGMLEIRGYDYDKGIDPTQLPILSHGLSRGKDDIAELIATCEERHVFGVMSVIDAVLELRGIHASSGVIKETAQLRNAYEAKDWLSLLTGIFKALARDLSMEARRDKGTVQGNRVLIADDMGTGKTAMATLGKEYVGARLGVVICPSNLVGHWQEKLVMYHSDDLASVMGTSLKVHTFDTGASYETLSEEVASVYLQRSQDKCNPQWIIMSYDLAANQSHGTQNYTKFFDALTERGVDVDYAVFDEVHNVKNMAGAWGKMALDLAHTHLAQATMVYLSGTPVPNKLHDIWIQLVLLYPDIEEELTAFIQKAYGSTMEEYLLFSDTKRYQLVKDFFQSLDIFKLRAYMHDRMIRRKAYEVLDLPKLNMLEKDEIDLSHEVFYHEYDLFDDEREEYDLLLEDDMLDSSTKLTALRRYTLGIGRIERSSKYAEIKQQMMEIFHEHDKTSAVIFSSDYRAGLFTTNSKDSEYDHTLVSIMKQDPDFSDIDILEYNGEMSAGFKNYVRRRYLDNCDRGKKTCLIATANTIGEGVDWLTVSDEGRFLDVPYTVAKLDQTLRRLYREGQKKDVTIKILCARDTIETGIRNYIFKKQLIIDTFLEGRPLTEDQWGMFRVQDHQQLGLLDHLESVDRRRMRVFSDMYQLGEEKLLEYLKKNAARLAEVYLINWEKSFQGNNAKFVSQLYQELGELKTIVDLGSGPLILKRVLKDPSARVISLDIDPTMHEAGKRTLLEEGVPVAETDIVLGRMTQAYELLAERGISQVDAVNISLSLQDTVSSHKTPERARVLLAANKLLRMGGYMTITMPPAVFIDQPDAGLSRSDLLELWMLEVEKLGFTSHQDLSGFVRSVDNHEHMFENVTCVFQKTEDTTLGIHQIASEWLAFSKHKEYRRGIGSGLKRVEKQETPKASRVEEHNVFAIGDRVIGEMVLPDNTVTMKDTIKTEVVELIDLPIERDTPQQQPAQILTVDLGTPSEVIEPFPVPPIKVEQERVSKMLISTMNKDTFWNSWIQKGANNKVTLVADLIERLPEFYNLRATDPELFSEVTVTQMLPPKKRGKKSSAFVPATHQFVVPTLVFHFPITQRTEVVKKLLYGSTVYAKATLDQFFAYDHGISMKYDNSL